VVEVQQPVGHVARVTVAGRSPGCRTGDVEGYQRETYGESFADVYDDWYTGITDAEMTADVVVELAGRGGRVLELAVGTGRLALPISRRGLRVTGIDASPAMLAHLHARDVAGAITTVLGDMVDDLPDGPFDVALIAYNSLFNLDSADRQRACFAAVAARLAPGGRFVVEAFVPDEREGPVVAVRSMTASEVVLSISDHDPATQRAHGQFVQFVDGARVRLRPWSIRYAMPRELDAMATAAGFTLADRWEDFGRRPFGGDSPQHVSVYAFDR
jgi:SAM-dependent methyltransferase